VVYNMWVEGESLPLGVTGQHPVWSPHRKRWISIGEWVVGEPVQIAGGTANVWKIEQDRGEPVFNLEVDTDHCYRVGEQGILVHNASEGKLILNKFLKKTDTIRTANYVTPGAKLRMEKDKDDPLFKGYRNLGILYYKKDIADDNSYRLPKKGFVIGTGSPRTHAEQKLVKMLPKKGCPVIVEIYTERWPCESCEGVLRGYATAKNSGRDIQVFFIAAPGSGDDQPSAAELLKYYKAEFGYHWWED